MSYLDWKVGDKVVCVEAAGRNGAWRGDAPTVGTVYTIREMFIGPYGELSFGLVELERSESSKEYYRPLRVGYGAWRFRPVQTRKTDISIFTAMLTTKKRTVDA